MSSICIRLIESISSVKCIVALHVWNSIVYVHSIDVNSSIWYVESHVDKRTHNLYVMSNFIVSNKLPLCGELLPSYILRHLQELRQPLHNNYAV